VQKDNLSITKYIFSSQFVQLPTTNVQNATPVQPTCVPKDALLVGFLNFNWTW